MLTRSTSSVILALALLSTAGCGRRSTDDSAPEDGEKPRPAGEPSPKKTVAPPEPASAKATEPQIQRISGASLISQIASSSAKGTLVNAWASWCGSCRREFPMLIALRDNLASRGIDVVFVSVDEPESEGAAIDFASQRGIDGEILVAERPLGPFKQALNPKWPGMLPATFLFDEKGKLRYFWGGPVYENELLPVVEGFLAGGAIDGQANFGLRRGKEYRD